MSVSGNVTTRLEQVTVEWLTLALSNSGALKEGVVATFDVAAGRGNWSTRHPDDLGVPEVEAL